MAHLETVTADTLRDHLSAVDGKRPTQRLMLALNYKEGDITQPELAARYGVSEGTVYNWLSRLDRLGSEPAADVLYDRKRGPNPGRTRALPPEDFRRFADALRTSPRAVGYESSAWTMALARRYLADEFDVTHGPRHVRRLLHEAGLEPVTPGTEHVDGSADAPRVVWVPTAGADDQ